MYENLNNHSGDRLEYEQKSFIICVLDNYDLSSIIGTLHWKSGQLLWHVDIESVWFERKSSEVMLHISCKEMEGDIRFSSMQPDKQREVTQMVYEEMNRWHELLDC